MIGNAGDGWTDERVEALKKLWAEGYSASQVAEQLGGITRNGVLSKVHRLKLSGDQPRTTHHKQVSRAKEPMPKPIGTVGNIPLPEVEPVILTIKTYRKICGLPAALLQRAERQCCFPLGGEPWEEDFHFCTNERLSGKGAQYCEGHQTIMSSKGAPKRSHEWYVQRHEWAKNNPMLDMGREVLNYFEKVVAA